MKPVYKRLSQAIFACFLLIMLLPTNIMAQKKGGGGGGAKRPAPSSAPKQSARPAPSNKPAATNRSSAGNNAGNNANVGNNAGNRSNTGNNGNKANVGNNSGNRTNSGNKVNVDNSKRNVNINVDNSKDIRVNNSRNTAVRRAPNYRPYARPPYRYGGYRYNCYHPYFYHPYRPFVWGPMWHPWGFFITTMAVTAIIISVDADLPHPSDMAWSAISVNSVYPFEKVVKDYPTGPMYPSYTRAYRVYAAGEEFYYDEGVFYSAGNGGYTVVAAPVGAEIKTLPKGYETVSIGDATKNYYFGGAFYEKSTNGYKVVAPTAGTVVEHLSDGGEEVKMGDVTYVKLGDTYYQPMQQDGKNVYEVVDVEADK